MGVWLGGGAALAAGAYMLLGKKTVTPGGTGGSGSGNNGQFEASTSSSTTDAQGNQYQNQYSVSGTNSSAMSPGFLTTQAGAMPYSGGDVYVNYPANPAPTGTNSPQIHFPPASGAHQQGFVGGYWYTPQTMDDVYHLVSRSYGLSTPEEKLTSAFQAMNYAIDYSRIEAANPQADWTSQVPRPGVPLFIPPAQGTWQDTGPIPQNASFTGPPGYQPPMQQTTYLAAPGTGP